MCGRARARVCGLCEGLTLTMHVYRLVSGRFCLRVRMSVLLVLDNRVRVGGRDTDGALNCSRRASPSVYQERQSAQLVNVATLPGASVPLLLAHPAGGG